MFAAKIFRVNAHQVQDTSRALLLVGMLHEVEEALAGLTGPRSDGVRNLGLLATEVFPKAGCWDRLLAEPEVLLSEAESAVSLLASHWHLSHLVLHTSSVQGPCSPERRCRLAR